MSKGMNKDNGKGKHTRYFFAAMGGDDFISSIMLKAVELSAKQVRKKQKKNGLLER